MSVKTLKNIMLAKKITFETLLHELGSIINNSVITCDGIIDAAWLKTLAIQTKVYNETTKSISRKTFRQKYFNKFLYFTSFLINCYSNIDSCQ